LIPVQGPGARGQGSGVRKNQKLFFEGIMPKKLEERLRKEGQAKGLTGKRLDAYIYGTLRKTGWEPPKKKER